MSWQWSFSKFCVKFWWCKRTPRGINTPSHVFVFWWFGASTSFWSTQKLWSLCRYCQIATWSTSPTSVSSVVNSFTPSKKLSLAGCLIMFHLGRVFIYRISAIYQKVCRLSGWSSSFQFGAASHPASRPNKKIVLRLIHVGGFPKGAKFGWLGLRETSVAC